MEEYKLLIFILLVIIAFLIFSNISLLSTTQISTQVIPVVPRETIPRNFTSNKVEIYLPAVDSEGNGVVTLLKVQAIPGEGRILTNINQLLFWIDTQQSIQTAKQVAEKVTGIDFSNVDLIYTIETNASLIEGPSAGAALTIATIAAVENKTLNESVMITGTITPDGKIGAVGGIVPKAKAAKDIGATLFLVPEGQGTQYQYIPISECKEYKFPGFYQKICSTEYKRKKVNISKDIGIEVKEVSDIEEALQYFLV